MGIPPSPTTPIIVNRLPRMFWYPCPVVANRPCAIIRAPLPIADVLARAPTTFIELKAPPFDLTAPSRLPTYVNIDAASSEALTTWASSRALLQRDLLHIVVWHMARGKAIQVAEQQVLEQLCNAIVGATRIGQRVSRARVLQLQSGQRSAEVSSQPGKNIRAVIHLLDSAFIPVNEFLQTKDWDTYRWLEGDAHSMFCELIDLQNNHNYSFASLRRKFVQVVTVAREDGLVQRIGNPMHDEFVAKIDRFSSAEELRGALETATVGTMPLQWWEPRRPRDRDARADRERAERERAERERAQVDAKGGGRATAHYDMAGEEDTSGDVNYGFQGKGDKGGAGRGPPFGGRGRGDGGPPSGPPGGWGPIQPLKNIKRLFDEHPELFEGRKLGPLVNPEEGGDGQYGLNCPGCAGLGFKKQENFCKYLRDNNSPPMGKGATVPKPRDMVITHPQELCPNIHRAARTKAGIDPTKAWMIEVSPRDPFIDDLEVALKAAGKPPFRAPRRS